MLVGKLYDPTSNYACDNEKEYNTVKFNEIMQASLLNMNKP